MCLSGEEQTSLGALQGSKERGACLGEAAGAWRQSLMVHVKRGAGCQSLLGHGLILFPKLMGSCQEIIYLLPEHHQRIKRLLTILVHSLCLLLTYVSVVDRRARMSHAGTKGLCEGYIGFTEHGKRFGKTCTVRGKNSDFCEP